MKKIWNCRRSSIAVIGIIVLGAGLFNGIDTANAISALCIGIGASNAYEKAEKSKSENR